MIKQYKLAVIGNPIIHSKSPQIFEQFARQFDLSIHFDKIIATHETFDETVIDFFANGGDAIAVTAPFKPLAYNLANIYGANISNWHSANLLQLSDDGLIAHNTDGIGLVRDLTNRLHINLDKASILIIGSGAVVGGIIPALQDCGVDKIAIHARNKDQVDKLINTFSKVCVYSSEDVYDGVINTTPNLEDNLLIKSVHNIRHFAYDMNYSDIKTLFLESILHTSSNKLITSNGMGMLIMQAYYSFNLIFGKLPDTTQVFDNLV